MRPVIALKPLKYAVKLAFIRRSLRLYWNLRRALRGPLEPEEALVDAFADPARIALDVGANFGAWSSLFVSRFRACHAFEPQPRLAAALAEGAPDNLVVHAVAVSDRSSRARLRVPVWNLGRSTVEGDNTLDALDDPTQRIAERDVVAVRLDDLALGADVAFIKIDVEGHELAVLRGATELLRASRPAVLVETEDRHHAGAPAAVRALMRDAGYDELRLPGRNLLFVARG